MIGYRFHILFNDGFNHFQLCRFEPQVFDKFHREQIEFGLCTSFHYMHMDRRVVIGVKQESVPKQSKDSRHVFQIFRKNR